MARAATATDLQIVHVPIDDLHPDPANPRKINDTDLDSLTRSLREFGFVQPILARHDDHIVIGGHQRLVAARRLGMKTVPVIFLDVSLEEARLMNLALNKISGDWDTALLGQLLADLSAIPDLDLSLSGFEPMEMTSLLKKLDADAKRDNEESFDLEEALGAAERQPITKPGDFWLLGDHRLLCGDSTSETDVARLMDGKLAALMATDPPYLVDYRGGERPASLSNGGVITGSKRSTPSATRKNAKNWDAYHDPETSVDFFAKFLQVALGHLQPHTAVYQWHASRRQALVEQAWQQVGLLIHQTIVWVKDRPVLTHSHYLWQTEPCFYGWKEGEAPKLKPPSTERNVWEVHHEGWQNGLHPTQKPVELFTKPIEFHTRPGDIVYEPFLGSGTQLIAAERTGRVCYAMERESTYVDVAVKRWEAFSGGTAKRQGA